MRKVGNIMRRLVDSDIFKFQINKGNAVTGRIMNFLKGGVPGSAIINDAVYADLKKKILNRKKDKITNAYMNAIAEQDMILFTVPPEYRIPEFLPFMTFRRDGESKVLVNLSNHVLVTKNDLTNDLEYDITDHVNSINVILRSAYLALTTLAPEEELSPDALYFSAVLWADMFNKPLFDVVGFHDTQKYDAFTYFAMKFFLLYFMDCSEDKAESLISKCIPVKNDLVLFMLEQIERKDLHPFNGISDYLRTIFNNEVTSMKGIRINGLDKAMNVSFFLEKFSRIYSSNAFLSICAYPYFVYVLMSATSKCGTVKDKSFDRLFTDKKAMRDRLFVLLER